MEVFLQRKVTPDLLANRTTVSHSVTDAMRRMILEGQLGEGDPIRQDDIASQLGVSRIPVRQALQQLANEGLVDLSPHRRACVSSLSDEELVERIELRLWIEPKLIRLAIERSNAEHIALLDGILSDCAGIEKADSARWAEVNCRLHVAMYTPSRRPFAVALVERLLQDTGRYRTRMFRRSRSLDFHDEHMALVDQFRARDADRGAALLRKHIIRWKVLCLKARA